jgi:hypothetical protein
MKVFLNTGFGRAIGREKLRTLTELGFHGVRLDIPLDKDRDIPHQLIKELGRHRLLEPLFLIAGGNMCHDGIPWHRVEIIETIIYICNTIKLYGFFKDSTVWFEIGNEPDIACDYWKYNSALLNDVYWDAYQTAKSMLSNAEVITGGIYGGSLESFRWLDKFVGEGLPNGAVIGYHRYPPKYDMSEPVKGFESRSAEFQRLRSITGDKRLFITEAGLSQGPYREPKGFPLCFLKKSRWLSEKEQAEGFIADWNFYKRSYADILGYSWYQSYDGPDLSNKDDHYGIFRRDRITQKFICSIIKETVK